MDMVKSRIKAVLGAIGVAAVLLGCYCGDEVPLTFPARAKNFVEVNSPYDDWNCADPYVHLHPAMNFLFSSNRRTLGGTFDLQPFYLSFSDEQVQAIDLSDRDAQYSLVTRVAHSVNTDLDELGPTVLRDEEPVSDDYGQEYDVRHVAFARGTAAQHDLYVLNIATYDDSGFVVQELAPLNSTADDGYLTYHPASRSLLFHSNRDGTYKIWQAVLPDSVTLYEWLAQPTALALAQLPGIAAETGEDRTPFVRGNSLYFISTRPGGQGGWDIWKSTWNSGSGWSHPENLGASVNSSSDEYRPMVLLVDGSSNYPKVVFFSSNRPGGLGGYDLYYAGIR